MTWKAQVAILEAEGNFDIVVCFTEQIPLINFDDPSQLIKLAETHTCITVEPQATAPAGGSEICFPADDVDALYSAWIAAGISILQKPTDMDFGRTFVALDPDGHRIRVYRLREQLKNVSYCNTDEV